MGEKSKEELEISLKKCNEEIGQLQKRLIDSLNTVGIEYIDLYAFIGELDILTARKNKLSYLLAVK